jgi:uridylate kinase
VDFLSDFSRLITELLEENAARRFIFVTGGGGPARAYISAFREIVGKTDGTADSSRADEDADWLGIMATRLNAELVRALFSRFCPDAVVTNPTAPDIAFRGRVLVAAGWKPGFSSDNDAALLAARFGAKTLINLSNIEKVYTADPKTDGTARPLDAISWSDFRALTGGVWTPGKNTPFDPIASAACEKAGIRVICAAGRNLPNLRDILTGKPFIGTVIGSAA